MNIRTNFVNSRLANARRLTDGSRNNSAEKEEFDVLKVG